MNDQAEAVTEEVEAPEAPEAVEVEDVAEEVVEDVTDGDTEEEIQPDAEYEDIEINGKVYSLPKELKESVMKNADYTQKTQTLAEKARALEETQSKFQEQTQRKEANFKTYTELSSIDSQIGQYENVDWDLLQQQDPALAQQHQFNLIQLQNQKRDKEAELRKQEQQFSIEQQHEFAKRSEENGRVIASEIEGWSEEVAQETLKQANALGFSQKFIQAVNQGAFPEAVPMIKAVHKARLYDQMIAKAKTAKTKEPVKVVPSKKVVGKSAIKKNVYSKDMSTEERLKAWSKK